MNGQSEKLNRGTEKQKNEVAKLLAFSFFCFLPKARGKSPGLLVSVPLPDDFGCFSFK
ncbi:MAG: hypothetical protein K0Q73_574 [Paenibacillus sp.]|jgi:hypothetical protein|nr:hypothetical protein [Paenibacillus sp.]